MTINYLMVYLSGTLRTLSQESSSSALFTLPNLNNDEMQFYPFPPDRKLDYLDLKRMIYQQTGSGAGSGSIKPLGDNSSMSPRQQSGFNQSSAKGVKEDPKMLEKLFNRKFSIKHGWKCFIMERSQVAQSNNNKTVIGATYSTRPFENRRATTFFSLRENTTEVADPAQFDVNKQKIIDSKAATDAQTQKQIVQRTSGKENIEESPRASQ